MTFKNKIKKSLAGMVALLLLGQIALAQEPITPYISLHEEGIHMNQEVTLDQAVYAIYAVEGILTNQSIAIDPLKSEQVKRLLGVESQAALADKGITREDYYNILVQTLIQSGVKLTFDASGKYVVKNGDAYKTPYITLAMMSGLVEADGPFEASAPMTQEEINASIECLRLLIKDNPIHDTLDEVWEEKLNQVPVMVKSLTPPNLIAHGGGTYGGVTTPNTLEAIETAILNGYTYIEIDFLKTSDNQYVLAHDWWQSYLLSEGPYRPKTRDEFLLEPSKVQQQKIDFDTLIGILDANPQIRIITDTKDDNIAFLAYIMQYYATYVDRFIPQIYEMSEYNSVRYLGYNDIIYSLYKVYKTDNEVIRFASNHKLFGVTMATSRVNSKFVQSLINVATPTYVHTVNDSQTYQSLIDQGVKGVYTDLLVD